MSAILKWMLVLLLLIAVAGGGGVYWCYVRSDEMLRAEVLKQFEKMAPDLKFGLERANFDFTGRIRLVGLSIQLPGDVEPAFYVPETIVTLEDEQLTDFENVAIQRLKLVHPQLHLVRQRDGQWNWQGIALHFEGAQAIPEFEVEHGTAVVELQRQHHPPRKLKLTDLSVSSLPESSRKLTAVVSTRIEPAGPLTATIEADLDGPPLSVEAKWQRLPVDDDLLELIGELSPTANAKLQEAHLALAKLKSTQVAATPLPVRSHGQSARSVNASPISLRSQFPDSRTEPFGLKVNCDLHCRLNWRSPDSAPQFQLLAELHNGQLNNSVLPFPLYEISGAIYVDPRQIIFRELKAENGTTHLAVDSRTVAGSPQLDVQVRGLPLDEALLARVPETLRKIIQSYGITGICDIDLKNVSQDGRPVWHGDVHLSQGAILYDRFPYPIRDVSGIVRMRGPRIEIKGVGKASGVPISMDGWIEDPGPANECEINVKSIGVPINAMLLDACPENISKAIAELNLQGIYDVVFRVNKEAGPGEKYHLAANIRMRDCSCMLNSFAYRIHKLRGMVEWRDDVITFKDLKGDHDETRLTGSGRFLKHPDPGQLELVIHAENAAFDRSLQKALPESLQGLWDEFQPTGRFDLDSKIAWIPGHPCHVTLPRIKITEAEVTMRSFPWLMSGLQGEFAYEAPRLLIKSVSARHDDTTISGRGAATFAVGEPWRVRFDELHVDDLIPNSTFRKALPGQLQRAFDTLSPSGKFSVATTPAGAVEFWGTQTRQSISADWDVQVLLSNCDLTAGIRVEDIHGRVDLKGRCNGESTNMIGQLDLDTVSVFRQPSGLAHQISRVVGPISLQDGQFTGGSRVMAMPPSGQAPPPVPASDRITGDVIDGRLTLDVIADLREEPDYRMQVTLSRGRLESYARQYLRGQSDLAGVMNGWLYLWGKGRSEDQIKGRGAMQIAPAALYELPLFVQLFQALRMDADRTAFDRADVLYNIQNSRFNFETIDLVGKAISLRGRGYVRFDGAMQLDFYSDLARNQIRIPVIHEIAGMLSRGWVGVKVTGNIGSPQTKIIPVPELDEAMKQFLGSFEPQPPARPNSSLPRLFRP